MRKLSLLLLLAAGLGLGGCYAGPVYARPACVRVWVPGHYTVWGRWQPGHWRCA